MLHRKVTTPQKTWVRYNTLEISKHTRYDSDSEVRFDRGIVVELFPARGRYILKFGVKHTSQDYVHDIRLI